MRNGDRSAVSRPRHARFLSIPQSPVCYWLRERFFELLEGRTLGDVADVCQGLATANDPRFVRFTWEAPTGEWRLPVRSRRWVPFEKGGGYGKWFGHHFWVVDWAHSGGRIKSTPNPRVQNEQYYFREGRTYSYMARGSIGVRRVDLGTITCDLSAGVFERIQQPALSSILNSRIASYVIRSISAKIQLRESYVSRIPLPPHVPSSLANTESVCIVLKRHIIAHDPIERSFGCIPITGTSLAEHVEAVAAVLHTLEGLSEREVFKAYGIEGEDLQEVLDETGTPAGWFPLIKGYDALFPLTPALSLNGEGDWRQGLLPDDDGRLCLKPADLDALKSRLRALYEAGPGTKEENGEADTDGENGEEEENDQIALGARIPIPAESFLEELSQKLEVHPISVYWLLKEGITQEGWRCLPEEQRLIKDRFTVLILRLLGHRWPKQIEVGEPVPEWADDDGIIPLTEGTDKSTLYARLRERLAADFGDEKVSSEENVFEEVMGKPLSEWVRNQFFRHHISQFKKRPIAWHLTSARWTGRPRQEAAFECLVYYHKKDGGLLPKIRSQYVGPLIKRLDLELRGLENGTGGNLSSEQENRKALLRDRIPELKAFDGTLADVIATGFGPKNMKSMLRQYAVNDAMLCLKCRWLKKLSDVIHDGPLASWQKQADQTGLHADFSTWIAQTMTHLDHHCAVVGTAPPEEKVLDADPTARELAELICAEVEAMLTDSLECACMVWWKSFDSLVLKPVSEKIRDAKKEWQSLKERSLDPKRGFNEHTDIKRKMSALKSDIKVWQKELALKAGHGQSLRDAIESWLCPEALTWEPWLAGQDMFDQLSSLNGKRPPPQTVGEFIRQESLYQPDINDGVRVNIAPLQKAGLLTTDVLAGKDLEKAIADRAVWRDDERRWCREGKLPKPGWWE